MKKITGVFACLCLIAGSTSANAQSTATSAVSINRSDRSALIAPRVLAPNEVFVIVESADTSVPTRSHITKLLTGADLARARAVASNPSKPMKAEPFKVTVTHSTATTEPTIKEGSNTSSVGK
jgi:hypothetical protein